MRYAVFTIVFAISHAVAAQDCLLSGKWVSNEQLTLESMNETGNITEKQRALFSKGFFGKLKLTYTCNSVTSLYEGSSNVIEYELNKNNKGGFTIKSVGDDVVKYDQEIWLTDDKRCYYAVVGNLNFNEYFCKYE